MATKKSAAKKPAPDLKAATRNCLDRIAEHADTDMTYEQLFGIPANQRTTAEETTVLVEAKKLAVNYIRMGTSR